MTLNSLPPHLGDGGGAGLHGDEVKKLAKALGELQRPKVSVAAGGASGALLTVAGILPEDTLTSVVGINAASAGVFYDNTAVGSIPTTGKIAIGANTTGQSIQVFWFDKTA